LLLRLARLGKLATVDRFLVEWEQWAAELLESHLSFPVLSYYRSQHDNQSWLAAFTAILDVCALLIAYGEGETKWRAQLTFAMCRHAVADLCEIMRIPRRAHQPRLSADDLPQARALLVDCGVGDCSESGDAKLRELEALYEPYLHGLSRLLCVSLPSWGVGAEFAKQPKSKIWATLTSASPARPGANPDDEPRHL
jgi:hypothetical protein